MTDLGSLATNPASNHESPLPPLPQLHADKFMTNFFLECVRSL